MNLESFEAFYNGGTRLINNGRNKAKTSLETSEEETPMEEGLNNLFHDMRSIFDGLLGLNYEDESKNEINPKTIKNQRDFMAQFSIS